MCLSVFCCLDFRLCFIYFFLLMVLRCLLSFFLDWLLDSFAALLIAVCYCSRYVLIDFLHRLHYFHFHYFHLTLGRFDCALHCLYLFFHFRYRLLRFFFLGSIGLISCQGWFFSVSFLSIALGGNSIILLWLLLEAFLWRINSLCLFLLCQWII